MIAQKFRRVSLSNFCTAFAAWIAISYVSTEPVAAQKTTLVGDGFQIQATDWPWWRGPDRNGAAAADQSPPLEWSESSHVVWKKMIPGRGYGSFSIVGDKLFLQTADESNGAQMAFCLSRTTGAEVWKAMVHASGGMRKNSKSTSASSTPACDGERVFVSFPNEGSLITTCMDMDGNRLWQTKVSDYVEHQGYGASPALYQSLVIVNADNKGGGAIAALDRKSGQIVWKRDRPKQPNYPSPIVLHIQGRDQIVMTGCDKVTSLHPMTGETLWEVDGATTECVTSTVTDGERVFTSGGYPRNHMSAIAADGSGKVVWQNNTRVYVPSFLIRNGYLYGVLDAGIAACWKSETGEEVWKQRLGGTFSASPVLVGNRIFATNEAGETHVFLADPAGYKQLAVNQLGEEVLATPVFVNSQIFYRATNIVSGKREEYVYCLGN